MATETLKGQGQVMTTEKAVSPTSEKDGLLVSVTRIPGVRNRAEYEGLPYGTQASAHNWVNCK